MSLLIQSPGLQTTLQDQGRAGHRNIGVPASGAADPLSLALANYCVGNPSDAAGLECTLLGPDIKFEADMTFALCGAQASLTLNEKTVSMNTAHSVKAGNILSIGAITQGVRNYLAIGGGLAGNAFLGSVATYNYAALGGLKGAALAAGDRLEMQGATPAPRALPYGFTPRYGRSLVVRVMPGPEYEALTEAGRRRLTTSSFLASAKTDRMGAQLLGKKISLRSKKQLISSPLRIGTVQVPPSGDPILMLADGHCTGGYVRALQVINADRYILGQIAPDCRIHFVLTDAKGAQHALAARRALYGGLVEFF